MIWDKISTYNETIQKYINCGQSRNGKYVVLFDRRRLMKVVISPDVSADLESELSSTSQKVSLSNTRNKQSFIDFLVDDLKPNGHTVRQSVSDADVDILSSVLGIRCERKNVTLVGADTELLILLLFMWNDSMDSMIMKREATKKHSQITSNTGEMAKCFTQIKYLTFIHAFGGCA